MKTEKRGGARKGTGPKATASGKLIASCIMLDAGQREIALKIGGTVSEGVRLALIHAAACERFKK